MKPRCLFATTICGLLLCGTCFAQNLLKNGSFDNPTDRLGGWITDYAWSKNKWYLGNKDRVSVVDTEQGLQYVVRLESTSDEGTKIETVPIPFEEGYRYTCSLKFKGPDYRIYFAGYKWRPGVKPHDQPTMGELRTVYRSKTATALGIPRRSLFRKIQQYGLNFPS